jgi:hypothetical protein
MAAFAFMCVEGCPNTRLKTSDIIWKSVIALFSYMGVPRIRDGNAFSAPGSRLLRDCELR